SGPPLAAEWNTRPPRLVWRHPVGAGYAAFAVVGHPPVTIEQRQGQGTGVCYGTAPGNPRGADGEPALLWAKMGGPGHRATPTIVGEDVYSLGATGVLVCLELRTGKLKWSVNILEDNDNLPWGMSGSPLVSDQVVVVNPGAQRPSAVGRALVAYDRAT